MIEDNEDIPQEEQPEGEAPTVAPEVAELQKQVAELTGKFQEVATQKASLEARLSEVPQPGTTSVQPQVSDDTDFRERAKAILESAGVDSDAGAKQLESLINQKAERLTQNMSQNVRQYIQIDKKIGDIEKAKPHISKFRPQFEQRLAQYIQAGHPAEAAIKTVEAEYDKLFEDILPKPEPQQPQAHIPAGAKASTAPNVEPPPPREDADDSKEGWLEARTSKRDARLYGIRR